MLVYNLVIERSTYSEHTVGPRAAKSEISASRETFGKRKGNLKKKYFKEFRGGRTDTSAISINRLFERQCLSFMQNIQKRETQFVETYNMT